LANLTSIAKERERVIGAIVALAAAGALVFAPGAPAAGEPIAKGTFRLNLSATFKAQLRANGVKMTPRSPKFLRGSLDPTTGTGKLKLAKISFRKGGEKVVYRSVEARIGVGGAIKGSAGKLFALSRGNVERIGFGALVSGVRIRFPKGAARTINRRLGLGSLRPGRAGTVSFSEQPKTVAIEEGRATIMPFLPPVLGGPQNGVAAKIQSHCIDPFVGVAPIAPASLVGQTFHFPVVGGTVGPTGKTGVIQLSGGVRLANGDVGDATFPQPASCPDIPLLPGPGPGSSTSYLEQTNLAPNLELGNVQANAFLGGTIPGCWTANDPPGCNVIAGDKGIAIGQVIDMSNASVKADPSGNPKTVTIDGLVIKNNDTSSLVLNGLFPNASTDPGKAFADGDLFGTAAMTLEVR
jgi:hypothetical protein